MKSRLSIVLLLMLVFPATARADGFIPILNFFSPDTWFTALFATAIIVLLESGLLRWRIKGVTCKDTLKNALLINIASSIAGSVVLLAAFDDPMWTLNIVYLVLILFVVTLVVEIPILHRLYRDQSLPWKRSVRIGLGINIGSYGLIFALPVGLISGTVFIGDHLDKQDLARWNHPELPGLAAGTLYSCSRENEDERLWFYDAEGGDWIEVPNSPRMEPRVWDIEVGLCAYLGQSSDWDDDNKFYITKLPDFAVLHEFNPGAMVGRQYDTWQRITRVAISPDGKSVAVLFRVGEVLAPRNDWSHFDVGQKSLVLILDAASGEEIARSSRWGLNNDLCWMADTRRILYYSLDDAGLFEPTQVQGSTSYGIGYAKDDTFKGGLYSFDIQTSETVRFADGYDPSLAAETGQLLVRDRTGLYLLEPDGTLVTRLEIPRLGLADTLISPRGDYILAGIQPHTLFDQVGLTVLMPVNNPDLRHVMNKDYRFYTFKWLRTP